MHAFAVVLDDRLPVGVHLVHNFGAAAQFAEAVMSELLGEITYVLRRWTGLT